MIVENRPDLKYSNTQAYIFRPESFKEQDDKDLKEYQENQLKKKYT